MSMTFTTLSSRQLDLAVWSVTYLSESHRDDVALDDAFGCTHDELRVLRGKLGAGLSLTVDQRELAASAVEFLGARVGPDELGAIFATTREELGDLVAALRVA